MSPKARSSLFERSCRICAFEWMLAQGDWRGHIGIAEADLHVESGLVQVEGDALRRKLHRAAAADAERKRRRGETAAQLMGFVQIALGGEEESVSGERLRQKSRGDLALFLKDDVGSALRSTACAMAARSIGICQRAGSR